MTSPVSPSPRERRLDYVEFASTDPAASRRFFSAVFGWTFVDYGPDYTAFDDGRLQGGFFRGSPATTAAGAALLVIYADDLAPVAEAVAAQGGQVVKPVFSFPGAAASSSSNPAATNLPCGPSAIRPDAPTGPGRFLPTYRG